MSISPTPSAPQTPRRTTPLVSINPNEQIVRGTCKSEKTRTDGNGKGVGEWQSVSHARRCISCNALGPCPCRGVSLPPEEKRRRIEAVLANTDFARTRQRREFIRVGEIESRERVAVERSEEECRVAICRIYALHSNEAVERRSVIEKENERFADLLRAREACLAIFQKHISDRSSLISEEFSERGRLAATEHREYHMCVTAFVDVCHWLVECLIEQAEQREAFEVAVMDVGVDIREEEEAAFNHIVTFLWQASLEDVAMISESKALARASVVSEAEAFFVLLTSQFTDAVESLREQRTIEGAHWETWLLQRADARRQICDEADTVLGRQIPEEFAESIACLRKQFLEEFDSRILWARSRAIDRETLFQTAAREIAFLAATRESDLSTFKIQFEDEMEARKKWILSKETDRCTFSRNAVTALLLIQSQRADEVHTMHDAFLAEYTQRLEWIDNKNRGRAEFTHYAESCLWDLFTAARDEVIHLIADAEESVADVLAILRAKEAARATFLKEYEESAISAVVNAEEKARERLATQFYEEHVERENWIKARAFERASAELEEYNDRVLVEEEQGSSRADVQRFADAVFAEYRLRQKALLEATESLGINEFAGRSDVQNEEDASWRCLFSQHQSLFCEAQQRQFARMIDQINEEEANSRMHHMALREDDLNEVFVAHRQCLSVLVAAAQEACFNLLMQTVHDETEARNILVCEAIQGADFIAQEFKVVFEYVAERQRAALVAEEERRSCHMMQLAMLRESFTATAANTVGYERCSEESLNTRDFTTPQIAALRGLPPSVADALWMSNKEQLEQLSAVIFAYSDHVGSISASVDGALRRGTVLSSEESRVASTGLTLEEQRDYYANKLFTDNATQQAKLGSMRQTVVNRKSEARRIEGTLKEAEMELSAHKSRVEGMKDNYRGKH